MENEKASNIGERIKAVRLRLGLNQEDLGEKLGGLAISTISGYESGDRPPRADTLAGIARLGGVSLDWLITGQEVHGAGTRGGTSGEKIETAPSLELGNAPMAVTGHARHSGGDVPSHAEASNEEINVHNGMMITSKILSSKTGYAKALWENLKSFEAAVDKEGKVKELEQKMDLLLSEMASMREEIRGGQTQQPEKKHVAS